MNTIRYRIVMFALILFRIFFLSQICACLPSWSIDSFSLKV